MPTAVARAEDVDLALCAHDRARGLLYRSLSNPRVIRDASGRDVATLRGDATALASATLRGDALGYVGDARVDADAVTYVSRGGFASTSARAFALDARGRPTRQSMLPRLAPVRAADGRAREDGSVTLIAVGGAAIACTSGSVMRDAPVDARSSAMSAFRRAASTALSVARAVVDASADVGEDAIAYEGEDMDEVSKLKRERVEWHCAFVDAPRRYSAFEYERSLDVFCALDATHHRALLFRVIGRSSIRLMCVIKGCRDASFAFDAKRRALVLHRPSVRVVESRPLRDASSVDVSVDARDVCRVVSSDDGAPRLVFREPNGARVRVATLDEATRRDDRAWWSS